MKLRDYIEKNCMSVAKFCRKCGVSRPSVARALEGENIYLYVAVQIEEATHGKVSCAEMVDREKLKAAKMNNNKLKKKEK